MDGLNTLAPDDEALFVLTREEALLELTIEEALFVLMLEEPSVELEADRLLCDTVPTESLVEKPKTGVDTLETLEVEDEALFVLTLKEAFLELTREEALFVLELEEGLLELTVDRNTELEATVSFDPILWLEMGAVDRGALDVTGLCFSEVEWLEN